MTDLAIFTVIALRRTLYRRSLLGQQGLHDGHLRVGLNSICISNNKLTRNERTKDSQKGSMTIVVHTN